MRGKNKLKKFAENRLFKNIIQPERSSILNGTFSLRGKWKDVLKNTNPIVLELGCGKGEYTLALADIHPDKNFIGVDIKGARLWRGAKTSLQKSLNNVLFLRTQIELIDCIFAEDEVSEIWITFPDPQIKFKRSKHRLTNPSFLGKYKEILTDNGVVHLKTDSQFLYGYTIGILEMMKKNILYTHHDIYKNNFSPQEATSIQTFYEKIFLEQNKAITYTKFCL